MRKGSQLNLNFLKTFGCKVYALDKSPGKDKFALKGKEGTFVEYSDEVKDLEYGCRLINVIIARDVRFLNKFTDHNGKDEPTSKTTEDEYESWMEICQKPEPLYEEELHLLHKPDNEHIEEIALEQPQDNLKLNSREVQEDQRKFTLGKKVVLNSHITTYLI